MDPTIDLTNFNHMSPYERGYVVARYGDCSWVSSIIPSQEENPHPIASPEYLDYDEGAAKGHDDLEIAAGISVEEANADMGI